MHVSRVVDGLAEKYSQLAPHARQLEIDHRYSISFVRNENEASRNSALSNGN